MNKPTSLYVHIPFCLNICSYCDFCKVYYNELWADEYLIALENELNQKNIKHLKTIYIGGGTPSSLNEKQLETLLKMLQPYAKDLEEYTIELNPETINDQKLILLKNYGINRVSVGIQSFNDEYLKIMERNHQAKDITQIISKLKSLFNNITVDFIYGFQGQTIKDLEKDLKQFIDLDINHISIYTLTIPEMSKLHKLNYLPLNDHDDEEMYDFIIEYLDSYGFNQYEVSNFARLGYQAIHNKVYWQNQPYYAIGLGASGYENNQRYQNTKSITKYLKQAYEPSYEVIDKETYQFEKIMLGLRMNEGIEVDEGLLEKEDVILNLVEKGLVEYNQKQLKATKKGMKLLDEVILALD